MSSIIILLPVSKEFDAVADGEIEWTKTIDDFYKIFHPMSKLLLPLRTEH